MSQDNDQNLFRPDARLDEALQRELDEALGGRSLEELLEADEAGGASAGGGYQNGRVISIQGDDIFVDLGGKSQGLLPANQFRDQPLPKEGDLVEVKITAYDRQDGLLLLAIRGAAIDADWSTLEEGQVVEGRVSGHNKGGLELTINGIRAFMPISQIELFRVETLTDYINQKLRCQVTDVNPSEQRLVVSRRAVLEKEAAERRERMYEALQAGEIVTGTVRSIMPYGAFVDLGGVDGLLHVSDMSYQRVNDPKEVVQVGQRVDVKILKVDRENRRISLGLKQVAPDPWTGAETKWTPGDVIGVRIARLADFGAFAELEPGVEGLIPISEMTYERRLKHPGEVVHEGDVVKVRVLNVDIPAKRISLSLRKAGEDPWEGASVRWPEGSVVDGIVKRTTDFGAFVEIAPNVQGLVHISELSTGFVRSVGEAVSEGQRVQAKVLGVDEEKRRISLSIKQAMAGYQAPEGQGHGHGRGHVEHEEPAAPPPPPRKRKRPLKGGLD